MVFLVLCLPRSRSAWMAHFLNYPLARPLQPVGHDLLGGCQNVDEFLKWYRERMVWGSVETSGAPLWKIVRKELPDCRIVVVKRPLIEVYRSLTKKGVLPNLTELAEMAQTLDVAASAPGVATIEVKDLDIPEVCQWLFEYCLDIDFDFDWWVRIRQINIQVDMEGRMKLLEATAAQRQRLMGEVLERSREIECLN